MNSIRYCHPNVIYFTIRFIAARKKGDVLHTCKTKYLMPMTPCSLYLTPDPCGIVLEAATIVSTLYYVKTTRQIWLPNITGTKSPWIPTRGRWTTWWHWTTEQVGFATIVWTPSGGKSEPDWLQRGPPSRTSKGRSWRPRHYVQQLLQGMRNELRRRLDWHLNKLFWGHLELTNHLVWLINYI